MLREFFKSIFSRNDISLAIVTILFLPLMYTTMISVLTNTVADIAGLSYLGETIISIVLAAGIGYWSGREIAYAAMEIRNMNK